MVVIMREEEVCANLVGVLVLVENGLQLAVDRLVEALLGDERDDAGLREEVIIVESLLVLVIDKLLPDELSFRGQDLLPAFLLL